MLNLFKYELKRAFSSKSTYVIMLVFILFTLIPFAANYYTIKNTDDPSYLRAMQTDSVEEFQEEYNNTTNNNLDKKELENLREETIKKNFSFEKNAQNLTGGNLILIMLTIFMAIAATKEYSSGYIKNMMTIKGYRKMMPFAKIFIAVVYAILLTIISFVIYAAISMIFTGSLSIDWKQLLSFTGINLLSLTAISTMIVLIANLSGNVTTTVTTSLLLVQNILTPFLTMFDGLEVLPFKLTKLSLINKANNFSMELPQNEMLTYAKELLMLGMIYLIVYTVLNLFVLNKKDINLG